jgi:MFS family permease
MLRTVVGRYREAYSGLPRDAWALSLILFVDMSGTMVIFFLSLYLTRRLGFSVFQSGQVLSAYGFGMLLGALLGGQASDRIGSRTTQQLCMFGAGLSLFALGVSRSFPAVFLCVLFYGLFSSALFPAIASAMAEVCAPGLRSRGFVLNRLASNLGATIGPVIGGFLARHDFRLLFWVDGTTCLLAGLSFFVLFPRARRLAPAAAPERAVRRDSWWRDQGLLAILAGTVGVSLIFNQLWGTFPIYVRTVYALPENLMGPLFAVNTVLIVLFQMVLTHGVERFPRGRVAAVGVAFLGLGFGIMPFGRGWLYGAMTVAVWTIGEMLFIPTATTLISLRASEENQGRYQSLLSVAFGLGFIAGPALGTRVYERFGGTAVWLGTAALAAVVAPVFLLAGRRSANGTGIGARPATQGEPAGSDG